MRELENSLSEAIVDTKVNSDRLIYYLEEGKEMETKDIKKLTEKYKLEQKLLRSPVMKAIRKLK